MHVPCALRVLAVATAFLAVVTTASADGPFEPNERATDAGGPLTGETVQAALETPQDVDWFRFYTLPDRQIGVLGTITSSCDGSSGRVYMDVLDGEVSYGGSLGRLT